MTELERLKEENARLKREIEDYKAREREIAVAEKKAKEKADGIVSSAEKLFDLEADRLRLFRIYFDRLFSLSKADGERVEKLNALALKIDAVINGEGEYSELDFVKKTAEFKRLVGEDEKLIGGGVRIGDGEDGFSMSDIINPPKEQDLEKLLSEMGIK